jgi:GTP-dependent phosphoenolpyruvate carboxykinase
MELNIGYSNNLKLKAIWLSRYFLRDQFLLSDMERVIQQDIYDRITQQYKAQNIHLPQDIIFNITEIDFNNIDNVNFLDNYVRRGIPVVIKNFNNKASKVWSPQYFRETYGEHSVEVINTSSVKSLRSTLREFYELSMQGEPLYLRSLSDIFDKHPVIICNSIHAA